MKTKDIPARSFPTQLELATLAAALPTGTAGDRVALAFEIWQAAAQPWELEVAFYRSRVDTLEARGKDWVATGIPITKALEELFPELPPTVRLARWEEFLRWRNGAAPSIRPDTDTVDITGVLFDEIGEFEAASKGQVFSNRGKAGAIGKHADKWVDDALADSDSQTLEILVSNTLKNLKGKWKGNHNEAKSRVEILIEEGLIVKTKGKLYGRKKQSVKKNENCS